jgi:hypothetical protein
MSDNCRAVIIVLWVRAGNQKLLFCGSYRTHRVFFLFSLILILIPSFFNLISYLKEWVIQVIKILLLTRD